MAIPITPEGLARLRAEHDRLWRIERPKVTLEVQAAAAQGDRSENAEYIYGKRRLREIDRRLRWLAKRFDELEVVRPGDVAVGRAYFGAWVTIEDAEGETRRYRLVGPDETEPERGLISVQSPLGRALLGRAVGDEVDVQRPAGRASYEILAIE